MQKGSARYLQAQAVRQLDLARDGADDDAGAADAHGESPQGVAAADAAEVGSHVLAAEHPAHHRLSRGVYRGAEV